MGTSNPSDTTLPPILTLPNEILHHILSFVVDLDDPFVSWRFGRHVYEMSQILVLRHICRHFRAITLDLNFWYESDFEITSLLPGWSSLYDAWTTASDRHSEEAQFLDDLFRDKTLVESLGSRKTEWMFDSVEVLDTVMDRVRLFKRNARGIHLEIVDEVNVYDEDPPAPGDSLARGIKMLSKCSHITSLSIRSGANFNLFTIASSFPFLENFTCSETDHFSGSLGQLTHLKKLHMDSIGDHNKPVRSWLPLRSTHSLTDLTLTCRDGIDISFFDIPSLPEFTNLKSFNIGPLSSPLVTYLLSAQCHLEAFKISLIRRLASIDLVTSMLGAPCLQTVKELGLSNVHDEASLDRSPPSLHATKRYWTRVLDAFTSMLSSVEEVQLDVPLDVESCAYFSRMTKLRLLNWDGSPYPYFGVGRGEDPKEKGEKALDTAFSGFVEKPQFAVRLIEH